jgi:hypothetical protein
MNTIDEDISTTIDKLCTLLQYRNSEIAEVTYNLVAAAKNVWNKSQFPKGFEEETTDPWDDDVVMQGFANSQEDK